MADDELKRLLEGTVSEIRRHLDVSTESVRGEIRTLAEAVANLDEKVGRDLDIVRGDMRQGFAETQAMIKFARRARPTRREA